jgi:hypothetical protein
LPCDLGRQQHRAVGRSIVGDNHAIADAPERDAKRVEAAADEQRAIPARDADEKLRSHISHCSPPLLCETPTRRAERKLAPRFFAIFL